VTKSCSWTPFLKRTLHQSNVKGSLQDFCSCEQRRREMRFSHSTCDSNATFIQSSENSIFQGATLHTN